jgi:hypothetical protein
MRLTITLNFRNDDGEPVGPIIDVPVEGVIVPPLSAPPRLALPPPRPWWRSKKPNMLDGAVIAATAAAVTLWLL